MKEGDREEKRDDKQYRQHLLIIDARHAEEEKAEQKDDELSCDHVGQDRAHEKTLFTLKQRTTIRTVVPDVKRLSNY